MLTIVILTHNSNSDLKQLLPQLSWAKEIVVIDDQSTDETINTARRFKARVFSRALNKDFAAQRNYGLNKATNPWVLFLDPDERISKSLKKEILTTIKKKDAHDGYYLKRQDIFLNKKLKFGETANGTILRLGKRRVGKWIRPVHEVWNIKDTNTLKHPLIHTPHKNTTIFLSKINYYTDIDSTYRHRKKETINLLGLVLFPLGKFISNYFLKLGILDGIQGFIMAFMMSLHSFITRAKLYQLTKLEKTTKKLSFQGKALRILILVFFALLALGQFQRFQLTPTVAIYLHDFVLITIFGLWLFDRKKQIINTKLTTVTKSLAIFVAIAALSLLFNIKTLGPTSLFASLYLGRAVLYISLILILPDLRKRNIFPYSYTTVLYLLGLALAFGGLAQYFLFPDTRMMTLMGWDDHLYRAIGTLFDPNFLGLMMVLTLIVLESQKVKSNIIIKAFVFLVLMLTYSRSAFLAYFVAIVVISSYKKSIGYFSIRFLVLLAAIILLPRPGGEGVRLERTASITRRSRTQTTAVSIWLKRPILGVGFNGYRHYLTSSPKYEFVPRHTSAPDNSYLFILATTGIIGSLSFAYYGISLLSVFRRNPVVISSLAAASVHAMANNSLFFPWVMFWVLALISEQKLKENI